MRILIFCALKEEALPIATSLNLEPAVQNSRIYRGAFSDHTIQLIVTGMGRKNALKACEEYLKGFIPDLVFSCGYAGGLDSRLAVGDVVLSEKIVLLEKTNPPEGHSLHLEQHWKRLGNFLNHLPSEITNGITLTTSHVVSKATDKKRLGNYFSALSVDMESGFVARHLMSHQIPFFNLRVISDASHDDLKIDFSPWITKDGRVRRLPIVGFMLLHPSKIKFLVKIICSGQKARKNLARAAKEIIKVLPAA